MSIGSPLRYGSWWHDDRVLDADRRLPPGVIHAAESVVGAVASLEPLGGLSGRTVVRAEGPEGAVVLKGPVPAAEAAAARGLSEELARHGVRTPQLYAVVEPRGAGTWLVMEHLPEPLPRERWGADPEVVATLRGLHDMPHGLVSALPERYRPRWDAAMTANAAELLGADSSTRALLSELADRAQDLFEPRHVVSADPNPRNWRIDGDGRLVLLDLERITLATAALDLAILLPGLPDRAAAAAVVSSYGKTAPPVDDVLVAKAWSVVELAATGPDDAAVRDVVVQVAPAFLSWLQQL